jgi:ribonuclease HI
VEYEGLLTGLRVANALGIKHLLVKGDSRLVVNLSNKSYTPKDEHMWLILKNIERWKNASKDWSGSTFHGERLWKQTKSRSVPLIA